MPVDEKPSRNEDEYFAKQDAELLKERRSRIEAEADKADRMQHYMKCPKCGADLVEQELHGVKVDVCSECHGVWFDAGEIEQLQPEDSNPVRRMVGDFFKGWRR